MSFRNQVLDIVDDYILLSGIFNIMSADKRRMIFAACRNFGSDWRIMNDDFSIPWCLMLSRMRFLTFDFSVS